jgi:glycosyltransferase involved in cell wall biosynthesis
MAAGVPLIAADAGGPAEIIQDDVTGVLYRPGDASALADAMLRMRDAETRERLSAAALGALGPYSPGVVGEELERLYAHIASHTRHRR